MSRTALFAASFDPPTLGHLDIIQRAAKLVDHLIVGVAIRLEKKNSALLSPEQKVELLKAITKSIPNLEIVLYDNMTVEFAKMKNVQFLVRGLRTTSSVEEEFQMALANRRLSGLETLFILGDENLSHVSSSMTKEILKAGGKLSEFIPPEVEMFIKSNEYLG